MIKPVSIFFFFIYFLPFTVSYKSEFIFEFYMIMSVLLMFPIGVAIGSVNFSGVENTAVDNKNFYKSAEIYLKYVIVLYFLFRGNLLLEVIQNILNDSYLEAAKQGAVDRYDGIGDGGVWVNVAITLFLIYSILLGSYYSQKNTWKYIVIFVIMCIIESSELSRAGVLLSLSSFATELLIRRNSIFYNYGVRAYAKIIFFVIIVLSVVFLFSAYGRVHDSADPLDIIIEKLGPYTVAIYEALYIWMRDSADINFGYGTQSFMSIYRLIGGDFDYSIYDYVSTEYGYTNIYTLIKNLIYDFGILGCVLYFFSVGYFVSKYTYKKMGVLEYVIFRFILFMFLYFLYSPFYFTSVTLAHFSSVFIIVVNSSWNFINFDGTKKNAK